MTSDDDFELRDGQYHCTNESCDWWVPEGMEYLADDHNCDEWAESEKEMTDGQLTQSLQESIDAALRGESASPEQVEEFFSDVERSEADIDEMIESGPDADRLEELMDEVEMANGDTLEELREEDEESLFDEVDVDELLAETPGEEEAEEMTELEREVIEERMKDIEDEDSRGDIDELLDRLEKRVEDMDDDDKCSVEEFLEYFEEEDE